MIPIKFVSSSGKWVICSENDKDWYSYTEEEKKWANVMLSDCGEKTSGGKYTKSDVGTEVPEADLGSMFVWIPRYAYNIEEGYHTNTSEPKLEIQWLSGKSYKYIDEKGEEHEVKKHTDEKAEETKPDKQLIAHPAFTDGNENKFADGEWKTEVEGIWVSKFEAGIGTQINEDETVSSNTIENSKAVKYPKVDVKYDSNGTEKETKYYLPMFKGRQFAYNYITISQCYTLSLALDDTNNIYGLNNNANSHLMKNSEWGAVAYLAISKYGVDPENSDNVYINDVTINYAVNNGSNSPANNPNDFAGAKGLTAITGYSSTNKTHNENVISKNSNNSLPDQCNDISYVWNIVENGSNQGKGTKASTTGNITGIYDMTGCLANYTAAWTNYGSNSTNIKKYGDAFTNTGLSTYLATAYPAKEGAERIDFSSSYELTNNIIGDAIYETSAQCGTSYAWFNETVEDDDTSDEPFFRHGGYWYGITETGLCGLIDMAGWHGGNTGFFSVLIVE